MSGDVSWWWTWSLFLSLVCLTQAEQTNSQKNITLPADAAQIVYTPFLCNISSENGSDSCNDPGVWRAQRQYYATSTVVSVKGSSSELNSTGTVPQMFLRFRASAFYMFTSPQSTANTNITVSSGDAVTAAIFNSSAGFVSVTNLPESETTTVAVRFVPAAFTTQLDISHFNLIVSNSRAQSDILPPGTLPSSIATPSSTLLPSSLSVAAASSDNTLIVQAVCITLGLGLGLSAVAVTAYICYRRRKRRHLSSSTNSELSHSESSTLSPAPIRHQHTRLYGSRHQPRRMTGQKEKQFFGW